MHLILHLETVPHVQQEHLDLHGLPAQPLAQWPRRQRRQAIGDDDVHDGAPLALLLVARPGADGALVPHLGHVLEAHVAQLPGEARDEVHLQAQAREALLLVVAEVAEGVGRGLGQGAVVGARPPVRLLELYVAAGFEVSCSVGD